MSGTVYHLRFSRQTSKTKSLRPPIPLNYLSFQLHSDIIRITSFVFMDVQPSFASFPHLPFVFIDIQASFPKFPRPLFCLARKPIGDCMDKKLASEAAACCLFRVSSVLGVRPEAIFRRMNEVVGQAHLRAFRLA